MSGGSIPTYIHSIPQFLSFEQGVILFGFFSYGGILEPIIAVGDFYELYGV